ncbi:prohead protease/major capsid protein fusion protein [Brevundimonas aurantiaca]|uniref:prohead protease/major capsid protein fusion protein n=1 Tax=Brevundimonas aurantiaca TaxID=74316 RepID=UPI00301A1A38
MTDVIERPDTLTRAAITFKPESLNREAGTVDVTLSTGAAVQRSGFIERLAIGRENVEVGDRIPVLDAHRQTSIADVLGRVIDVRFEADRIDATLRISNPATLDAIERGDLTGISIGYRVTRWSETAPRAAGPRVRTATKWTLLEASLVPIPADPSAYIRSECTMTTQVAELPNPAVQAAPPAQTETRAAINAQIRSLAETAGLDRTWADAQIDSEADINSARAAAFEAMQRRTAPVSQIRGHVLHDNTAPEVIVARSAEALACRMTGMTPSDAARPLMTLGLHDHVRQSLTRAGENVAALGREELLTRSAQGTSDFPLILDGATNRVLKYGYGVAESPLKVLARPRSMTDLRPVTVLELDTASELQNVSEHGEIKSVQLTESGESYRLATYAGIIELTRTALINDDIGAFADVASKAGRLAAEKEAKLLADALTGGYKMRDGKALFHADHDNLAAAGAVLSVATLSAARQSLRIKTGLDGVTPANVTPKFLVVGAAQETAAEQILATLNATAVENQNVFAGKLQLVVDARISGNQWFVVADPATAPVFELAHLGAAPGPQVEVRDGWRTLGREWRVLLDVGVGVIDTRGAYKNPGA